MKTSRGIGLKYQRFLLTLGLCISTNLVLAGSCTVSSRGIAFGTYQPLTFEGRLVSLSKTTTATVSVMCTSIVTGGSYTISLGPSNYGSGNRIETRYLRNNFNGGDLMAFNVFTNASYTTIWGGSAAGSLLNSTVGASYTTINGGTGSLLSGTIGRGDSNQSHTVYGQISAGQNTLKAGNFSDSLLMTLTYEP